MNVRRLSFALVSVAALIHCSSSDSPNQPPGGGGNPDGGPGTDSGLGVDGGDSSVPQGPTEFFSSFEPKDPQPTWTNTVETGTDGTPKTSGVLSPPPPVVVTGNITDRVISVTANGENDGAGEVADNLTDDDTHSKWLVFESSGWIVYKLDEAMAVRRYRLGSANDYDERDPKDWTVQGSQDGETWVDLDKKTNEDFPQRYQLREFDLSSNTTPYLYYRLNITANNNGGIVQMSEWQIFDQPASAPVDAGAADSGADAAPPLTPEMRSAVGRGPTQSHNAKTRAGFTGVRGFEYGGTHNASERAYSYNKVFDVDVVVAQNTELSYMIHPAFTTGDFNYPSTYASVDLAFEDGTYLSDLGAVDQHGAVVSPKGQGDSKTLYTDDWNYKVSKIGAVAAGKRIKRILVAYDNPNGPPAGKPSTTFGGWIDDIRITANPAVTVRSNPSDWVDTRRGTNSSGDFSRGNNFPATAVPHGFNFWTPMTSASSQNWLYTYHRSNNSENLPTLQAFALSHEPSPWMGDRQSFQVMPSSAAGAPVTSKKSRALPFRHANEVAQAHYYSVKFENGIQTEIAPTDHAALFRFTFPDDNANLIFDHLNASGGLTLDASSRSLSFYSDAKSGLSAGATRIFVYAEFDRPVTASATSGGVTGYFRFGVDASNRVVNMRIATSLISVAQAKKNLELEIAKNDTFDGVKEKARQLWDNKLKVIDVEGASADQLTTLYSNLYRLFLYPNSAYENVGTADAPQYKYASPVTNASGAGSPTNTGAKLVDGKVYVNNGFWDTYRGTWSAYALLTPKAAGELVDGFVQQYKDGGWVSRWSSPGYADLMTGTSSDVAFADAYLRGVNFDAAAAYDAAVRNATVVAPNGSVGRKGNATSTFLGYTSTATGAGFSWAMAGYLNDYGIANLAKALSNNASDPRQKEYAENAEYFLSRSQNYVNLFDPSIQFFQGRAANGAWRLPKETYNPTVWGFDYTETNGWNMAFDPVHDGQGLANLYGGRDKLAAKLDTFFSTPEKGDFRGGYSDIIHEMLEARDVRMGQLGLSNQPSFHIPYMYLFTGQAAKTQAKVREALSRLFIGSNIGQGYPGDDDNGATSSWVIFSALGFFPLQVGSSNYVIGSPLFTKATVHLENGKNIVISAPQNSPKNVYVQSLKVNGAPYGKTYISHEQLLAGANLEFVMGSEPSQWGSGADDVPPSVTQGNEPAKPLHDVATGCNGDAHLYDNDGLSTATLTGAVQCKIQGTAPVRFYTLTSAADTTNGDPTDWVLEGSNDGTTWKELDKRTGQVFPWRSQTRAFKVADASATYANYRITVTKSTKPTTAIAEIELLAN
ncbi:GH92 family glycosyl hydrolase [Pendulispora brunnea]|uniref:GH92 family glycosyl hydrolase n=1 Tax=Pendulispora brunnea TaxID=2905690 RepID=A0ABZ2K9F9_9BACT